MTARRICSEGTRTRWGGTGSRVYDELEDDDKVIMLLYRAVSVCKTSMGEGGNGISMIVTYRVLVMVIHKKRG